MRFFSSQLLTGESLNGKENRGSSTAGEGGNGILVPFPIDGSDRLQSKLQVADERAAMLQKGLHMARQVRFIFFPLKPVGVEEDHDENFLESGSGVHGI